MKLWNKIEWLEPKSVHKDWFGSVFRPYKVVNTEMWINAYVSRGVPTSFGDHQLTQRDLTLPLTKLNLRSLGFDWKGVCLAPTLCRPHVIR